MRRSVVALVLPLVFGLSACGQEFTAPGRTVTPDGPLTQAGPPPRGTGLVLESLTDLNLPLVGRLDRLTIDQVVINEIVLGDVVGGIVGLEVIGTINGSVVELGGSSTPLVNEQFTSTLSVTPGAGGCRVVALELGPLTIDALGGLVTAADLDPVEVEGRGSGAVGSLLCALGRAVQPVVSGGSQAVRGLVNAINNLLI